MMDIKSMTALMAANDWRDRQKGLVQFQEMTESIPAVVGNHIVKVMRLPNRDRDLAGSSASQLAS